MSKTRDEIGNRCEDLFNECKRVLRQYVNSKNIRDEVQIRCAKGLNYCITFNESLHKKIYNSIEKDDNSDIYVLLKILHSNFYLELIAPVIGEYYLTYKELDLSDEEIEYLSYNSLGAVLFIISGMFSSMLHDANEYISKNK